MIIALLDEIDLEIDNILVDQRRLLGLAHQNICIDETEYDEHDNLISARVRIYSDSSSVGTNYNIVGTYQITSESDGICKFKTWKQVRV